MRVGKQRIVLSLILSAMALSSFSGCASTREARCKSSNYCQVNNCGLANCNSLPVIDYDSRNLLVLWDGSEVEGGLPKSESQSGGVRELTFEECGRLASVSSPAARQLECHRQWLLKNDDTQQAIIVALCHQARFERRVHVARALEAYLNLVEIHAQRPVIDEILSVIKESEAAIVKFRDAGVDTPGDPNELPQRVLDIDQQLAKLYLANSRLADVMEMLLELQPQPGTPIWTSFISPRPNEAPSTSDAINIALANRGDLLALEHLEKNSSDVSSESAQGILSSTSPLLSVSISIPGQPKWWQCVKRKEFERLKDLERCERAHQLHLLVEVKRELIRQEVYEALNSIIYHRELLDLKQKRLSAILLSLESEATAKETRPVEFKDRIKKEIEKLQTSSEVVHELIAIDVEFVRLDRVLGTELINQ